jgi:hypothetical protein
MRAEEFATGFLRNLSAWSLDLHKVSTQARFKKKNPQLSYIVSRPSDFWFIYSLPDPVKKKHSRWSWKNLGWLEMNGRTSRKALRNRSTYMSMSNHHSFSFPFFSFWSFYLRTHRLPFVVCLVSASATTTHKDRYFQFLISSVVEYFKEGKGWQGAGSVLTSLLPLVKKSKDCVCLFIDCSMGWLFGLAYLF